MVNLCSFISSFNHALLSRQRIFEVQATVNAKDFALYLRKAGYILGFHLNGKTLSVYPNHSRATFFKIRAVSTPSRPAFYGVHRIRRDLTAGKSYIIYVNGFFFDSHDCVMSNSGGLVVACFF